MRVRVRVAECASLGASGGVAGACDSESACAAMLLARIGAECWRCARVRGPCEVGDAEVGVDAEDLVEVADRCLVVPHLPCRLGVRWIRRAARVEACGHHALKANVCGLI